MKLFMRCASLLLFTTTFAAALQIATPVPSKQDQPPAPSALEQMFATKVKTEWDAFKNKDKKAYADLLADDFVGIEDDGQGTRKKSTAVGEIDQSVVYAYNLFALKVLSLNDNAALVTYELTLQFPPKVQVRFKRVLIAELWWKREGQWEMRYYQETRTR